MKTGVKTIIVGVSLFILGSIVVPLGIVLPFILSDSNEEQFKVPGTIQMTIEESGRYYLWNDYQTVFKGKSYNRSENIPDGMEISIKNAKTGKTFNFVSDTSISSSSGSSSKNSIGYIEIKKPENIEIGILGGNEDRIFSCSQSIILAMIGIIIGGIALSMLIALSGVGLTIWGIVKLVKSNKKGEQGHAADA